MLLECAGVPALRTERPSDRPGGLGRRVDPEVGVKYPYVHTDDTIY